MSVIEEIITLLSDIRTKFNQMNSKLDVIIYNTKPDFSKEDEIVRQGISEIKEAEKKLPPG